jgi:hypothetical protein
MVYLTTENTKVRTQRAQSFLNLALAFSYEPFGT